MTRTEYGTLLGESLSNDECIRLFDTTKDELLENRYKWNQSLEVAYQEFMDNGGDDMVGDLESTEDEF